jgi:hypothetical protein
MLRFRRDYAAIFQAETRRRHFQFQQVFTPTLMLTARRAAGAAGAAYAAFADNIFMFARRLPPPSVFTPIFLPDAAAAEPPPMPAFSIRRHAAGFFSAIAPPARVDIIHTLITLIIALMILIIADISAFTLISIVAAISPAATID